MKPNVSLLDGVIRLIVGTTVAGVFGAMGSFIGVLSVYFLVTSLTAWDPIYKAMGYYTCEENPYNETEMKGKQSKVNVSVPSMNIS